MTDPIDDDRLEGRLRGYLERFTSYPRPRGAAGAVASPGTRQSRRRLGLIAALTAAALCVSGVAAAALVVTLRGGVYGAAPGSTAASSGHSLFIPFAGPGTAANGGQSSGAAAAGPHPALGTAPAPASLGPGGSGAIYPGNYSCAAGAATQVAAGQVQAQGFATVGSADQATSQQLTIQVSGSGATYKTAVSDAQARQVAVDQALQGAGIALASITVEPVQIGQNGYLYYNPGQTSTPAATGIITVSSGDPVQLGAAADAARRAGGSQASSYTSYGTQFATPSSTDIAAALHDATSSAHDEAAAAASAAGLHLGKVSGLITTPPSLCYGGSGERLIVTVTIDYSVSS